MIIVSKRILKVFKLSCKISNFVNQNLDVLSSNMEQDLDSNVVNVSHYLADNLKCDFISAVSGVSLNVSGKQICVEAASMINETGLNIF